MKSPSAANVTCFPCLLLTCTQSQSTEAQICIFDESQEAHPRVPDESTSQSLDCTAVRGMRLKMPTRGLLWSQKKKSH